MSNLKPSIKHAGQRFVDDPLYAVPKPVHPLERALAGAFKRQLPKPLAIGYERVFLRWMKPGKDGGLVPR